MCANSSKSALAETVAILLVTTKFIVYDGLSIESEDSCMATKNGMTWQIRVKGLLKAELSRRNLTYTDLADKLAAIGIKEDRRNLSNKIARGSFTAVFFVQCLTAIGCHTLHLEDK